MLFVEEFQHKPIRGKVNNRYEYFMPLNAAYGEVGVKLSDTENPDVCLLLRGRYKEVLQELQQRRPYGYFELEEGYKRCVRFVTAVDKLSVKFLDLIDDIQKIRVLETDTDYKVFSVLKGRFRSVDPLHTVFNWWPNNELPGTVCSLLGAMLFRRDCWIGDNFYISECPHMYQIDEEQVKGVVVYKVSFLDVPYVRRLLIKAAVSGMNPIMDFISEQHRTTEFRYRY